MSKNNTDNTDRNATHGDHVEEEVLHSGAEVLALCRVEVIAVPPESELNSLSSQKLERIQILLQRYPGKVHLLQINKLNKQRSLSLTNKLSYHNRKKLTDDEKN